MKILAIDLGTQAGFATGPTTSSPHDFKVDRLPHQLRREDPRIGLFLDALSMAYCINGFDLIVFEDVEFGTFLAQVQLWSSFRGALWAYAHHHGIRVDCLNTASLKKFATGSGGANKAAMAKFLVAKHPSVYTLEKRLVKRRDSGILLTDDEVDALHLWAWANQTLA